LSLTLKHGITGRPALYSKVVNGLTNYLQSARVDPSLVLSILAIARATGLKKSTIYKYKDDPEVSRLLATIRSLDKARKAARLEPDDSVSRHTELQETPQHHVDKLDDPSNPTNISDDEIASRAAASIKKAVWTMSRFMGRHRRHRYVSDLPRVVFDLDIAAAEVHRVLKDLRPLSEEWTRRDKGCINAEQRQTCLFPNQSSDEEQRLVSPPAEESTFD
jgi:hypothetical protein